MSYEQQQNLIDAVTAQMQICADMLGPRDEEKQTKYGFIPGLGENELAKTLLARIESIRNGIFQVMFTGCFNSGKSTLINALIRRDALKTGASPETAVITKIFFNAAEEKVVIYKRKPRSDYGRKIRYCKHGHRHNNGLHIRRGRKSTFDRTRQLYYYTTKRRFDRNTAYVHA